MQNRPYFIWMRALVTVGYISFVACGCSKKNAPPRPGDQTTVSPRPLPVAEPSNADANKKADGAQFPVSALVTPTAVTLQNSDKRKLSLDLYKLANQRDQAAVKEMISFLEAEEKHIPDRLPDLEALKQLEKERPPDDHWTGHMRGLQLTVRYLILSDTKEGESAVDKFVERFNRKYAQSDVGQILCDAVKQEVQLAKKDLQIGLAPWTVGMSAETKD